MTAHPVSLTEQEKADSMVQSNPPLAPRSNQLSDILARLKEWSPEQIASIEERARKRNQPFGKAAVAMGLATRTEVNGAIAIQFGYHFDQPDKISVPRALISVAQPYSMLAEEFRRLRTQLLTSERSNGGRLTAIAGAGPGTGSSFVAANLAVAMAQLGRRTLLVDTRLRNPQLASLFESDAPYNIEDVVADRVSLGEALAPCCIRNLSLLVSNRRSHDPQACLSTASFAHFVADMADKYDSVIFDTTTGTSVADGRYVWALTKSVLVVARRNQTRVPELRALATHIDDCGAEIFGSVLMG